MCSMKNTWKTPCFKRPIPPISLQKKRIRNTGIVQQYYVEGNHEAIIPKDLFLLTQQEIARRRMFQSAERGKKRCYSCKHCFSQIVVCGECGEYYRRVHWNNRGRKSIVWRCSNRLEKNGVACHSRTVNEAVLEQVALDAINRTLCQKTDYLDTLQSNIAAVIQGEVLSPDVIDTRLRELQQELLKKASQKEDYDPIANEILRLRELRRQTEMDSVVEDERRKKINDLQAFIRTQPTTVTEFDEVLVRRLIAKIVVFEDRFIVEFKSGLSVVILA